MKRIISGTIMLACVLGTNPTIHAQTTIIAEGYSAAAQRALESLRQKNPATTLAEARLSVAQRGATMDARRNAAEFIHGIDFEYTGGTFDRKMTATTSGSLQLGSVMYRTLQSGLVVASLEVQVAEEMMRHRENLPQYEVTGICDDEGVDSIVMAMRQARMDAVEKAVRRAIGDRDPRAPESGRSFSGTVWLLGTVQDEPGIPYQVTMVVQVKLDR